MSRGGARPGAGRPRKVRTEEDLAQKAAAVAVANDDAAPTTFKTALDWCMHIINSADAPLNEKAKLAVAVLPFQTPKVGERPAGKKQQREIDAQTAGEGSEWDDDLEYRAVN